jgi:hypothetical protein
LLKSIFEAFVASHACAFSTPQQKFSQQQVLSDRLLTSNGRLQTIALYSLQTALFFREINLYEK